MNDRQLDDLARRSSLAVREEASRIADTQAALARLQGGEQHRPDPERGRRRGWLVVAVTAAATTAVIAGAVLLLADDDSLRTVDQPTDTTATPAPAPTLPVTAPAPTTLPATTPPPTTAPPADPPPTSVVEPMPADPLAGWSQPELVAPTLDDVPRMMPTAPPLPVEQTTRIEHADTIGGNPVHSQLWVRAGDDRRVDGIVQLVTDLRMETPPAALGVPIEIPGWPEAYDQESTSDVVILTLITDSGGVTFWSRGLTLDEARAVAAGLRPDGTSGWRSDALTAPDWTLFGSIWTHTAASRTLRSMSPEGIVEITSFVGVPLGSASQGLYGGDFTLEQIGGRPALAYTPADLSPEDPGFTSIMWIPADGVTTIVGSTHTTTALEIARSLSAVDQATWEAGSTVEAWSDDGCNSLFC